MATGTNHAYAVPGDDGTWLVVLGANRELIDGGYPTRAAARAAARELNGRRLRVFETWAKSGKPWLVVDMSTRGLVGTYHTREAARKAVEVLA